MTDRDVAIEPWSADRLGALTGLVRAALPDEGLGPDDLAAVTFEDDGAVLGTPAGDGAIAVVWRPGGPRPATTSAGWASVQVVAVHPDRQRRGVGRALLGAAEVWAAERSASHVQLGGAAPFYLWAGVDVRATGALCLAERSGYRNVGSEVDMALATTFRADRPEGVRLRRVLEPEDAAATAALVAEHWPAWEAEVGRAVDHGGCLVAVEEDGGRVLGFACHSVNRPGWFGPMGTDPSQQGRGVGRLLVSGACRDLMTAGFDRMTIAWVGPVAFYADLGATVSRSYRRYVRPLATSS